MFIPLTDSSGEVLEYIHSPVLALLVFDLLAHKTSLPKSSWNIVLFLTILSPVYWDLIFADGEVLCAVMQLWPERTHR